MTKLLRINPLLKWFQFIDCFLLNVMQIINAVRRFVTFVSYESESVLTGVFIVVFISFQDDRRHFNGHSTLLTFVKRQLMKKYLALVLLLIITSCKKDEDTTPVETSSLSLNLSFKSGSTPLLFDTINYTNAAGNQYSVSRLQFYISNIQLIKPDSSLVDISDYSYVDARVAATLKIKNNIPVTGQFIGMKLQVGLDSTHNINNALPATNENINMAWPDMMGGGYHFMKLEGSYISGLSFPGYAMHIGRNQYLVNCVISHSFTLSEGSNSLGLVMDINEWYTNPANYDFEVDGNYSMGVMAAMMKLKENGSDIFMLQ